MIKSQIWDVLGMQSLKMLGHVGIENMSEIPG